MMRYGFFGYPHMGAWGWDWGWLLEIFFVVLVIWLIAGIFLHTSRRHYREDEGDDDSPALGILKSRYAKGEITKKEFEDMKKDVS